MKKNALGFYFLSLSLFALFSCNTDSKKADQMLQAAENVVEQLPDSALRLLDSIPDPYELNERQQAKYFLLSVEAKDKTGKDISNDTPIFRSMEYFKKTKDLRRCALAVFYSGRVLESQKKSKEALTAFLEAESIAVSAQDPSITGFIRYNIGDAYSGNGLYEDAISKLKQASENFSRQPDDYKKEIMSLNFIGMNYAIINNMDSALFYFNKSFPLKIPRSFQASPSHESL